MTDDEKKKIEEDEDTDEGTDDSSDKDEEGDADEGADSDEDLDVDLDEDEEEEGEADGSEDEDEEGGDADEDDESEGGEDTDDDESKKKNLSAIAQKKKWRERALKAERELAQKTGKKPSGKTSSQSRASNRANVLINFRLDNPTLKLKEVEEIEAYAEAKGVSLSEALKSPVIKIMIARNKKKAQLQGGSVSPSRRSQPTKPAKDWSRAGREDMEAEVARRRAASRK